MCGISGCIHRLAADSQSMGVIQDYHLEDLQSRGPDRSAILEIPGHGFLAHSLLHIRGNTVDSSQPRYTKSNKFMLSYNGEVYSVPSPYSELLDNANICDTSVISVILDELGPLRTISSLQGMFALAIYSISENNLYLAVDKYGQKPLYYSSDDSFFVFSSSPSIFHPHHQPPKLDYTAVADYLEKGFFPFANTFYKGVTRLQPGSILTLCLDTWKFSIKTFSPVSTQTQFLSTSKIARQAVARTINSSSNIALTLSGGIDSSWVAATAIDINQQCISKAYTVSIPYDGYDEAFQAKKIADILKLDLETISFGKEDAWEMSHNLTRIFKQPFADSSALPYMKLMSVIGESTRIALGGDGADEMLGGYHRYRKNPSLLHWIPKLSPFLNGPSVISSYILQIFARTYPALISPLRYCRTLSSSSYHHLFHALSSYWPSSVASHLNSVYKTIDTKLAPRASFSQMYQQYDLNSYLMHDILTKTDSIGMHYGVEVRSPFLDTEYAARLLHLSSIPQPLGTHPKQILITDFQRITGHHYPSHEKRGFSIPIGLWLTQEPFRTQCDLYFSKSFLSNFPFLRLDVILALWKYHLNSPSQYGRHIWLLYCLCQFLEQMHVPN